MKKLVACCAVALAAWTAMAVPTKAEVDAARKVVAELMADDVADQKAGRIKLPQLAEKALELADRAETDAARLLLLQGALISFAQGGDPARAADVLLKIRTDIADVTPEYEADVLSRAVRSIPSRKGGRLYGLLEDARRLLKYRREIPALEKGLAAKGDPATRAQLAERFAALGDWKRALAEFAKMDDDAGRAARYTLRGEGKMTTAEVADIWWRHPGEKDALGFTVFQRYAAGWYARALDDGSLTGLNRELAQKRIDSVGGLAETSRKVSPDNMAIAYGERPQPLVLDLGDGVKMEMVGCPSGKFLMQYDSQELPNGGKLPVEITRPFWFGKYPVTIAEWERLMPPAALPKGVKRENVDPRVPVQKFHDPQLGWNRKEAEDFMERLTKKFRRLIPAGYVFRLPTDAEWVYAFRANSTDPNDPFGSRRGVLSRGVPYERLTDYFVQFEDCKKYWSARGCDVSKYSDGGVWGGMAPYIPVGSRRPNAWGIYDLGGPALEFSLDVWERAFPQPNQNAEWFEAGIRDPLWFAPQKPHTLGRFGFGIKDEGKNGKKSPVSNHGMRGDGYNLKGGWYVAKLRLVVGPDLLKERGLTPPKLDE